MKSITTYKKRVLSTIFTFLGLAVGSAQFLLQAPMDDSDGTRSNWRWYEASDTSTVLSTNSYYEATDRGVYFATYDGTNCGQNATGYFILTNCNSPFNEVTLDVSANPLPPGATLNWSPTVTGDPASPTVIATQTVVRYTATITKAGNSKNLPNFTVVCMDEAADLVDDMITVNEDESVVVDSYGNDSDLPISGSLTISDSPVNGNVNLDDNGTPNDPTDDIVTYIPNPDYNGPDTFDYTLCNTFGDCSTATVSVAVLPILDVLDDLVTTNENSPLDIDILTNDNDVPSLGTLTVTNPSNGNILLNNGETPNDPSDDSISYTPDSGFLGNDSFSYELCDAIGNCSTATVTVMVNSAGIDLDSDNDGIADSFEDLNLDSDNDPTTDATDTDDDGIPDYLDIDSDNDGILDTFEALATYDYGIPSGMQQNGTGIHSANDKNGITRIIPEDTDGDGIPDYVDEDSDNDNIPDNIEGHDRDRDGIPDVLPLGLDANGDGLDDVYEGWIVAGFDTSNNINNLTKGLPDTDDDGTPDYRDTDDDGDRIPSSEEDLNNDGNYANDDSNDNGIPEYLDPNVEEDVIEVFNVITPNDDQVHDTLKIDGLENYPDNSISIYNRWGVLVYSTQAYGTRGNVFKGTSEGRATVDADRKLPVGTYFYILDYKNGVGENKSLSGYLYINR
ncbi:gliding motility-associated C-terminal domain-containing protein [Pricia sp. S334]|uniref:Gliding motility-associated C-terminal domain-containing protein n=1 Tax=Pricia mediterranea TaxID=3076079 RepID=A0ABU3L241_9FLAO|nr:gliding motility-associated C-terminal domain-containing protein [Pricia sp. S334]MDT7827809.1 gliding motility-associated C-terminal domain-containing protein [Pricia sp. S334]